MVDVGEDGDGDLTQTTVDALDILTQPSTALLEEQGEPLFFMSDDVMSDFRRDPDSVPYSCLMYKSGDKSQPLCFFRTNTDPLDIMVGRGAAVDVVVPSADGKCGISRTAFRLLRSDTGGLSLVSSNTVPFFIRSPQRFVRVDELKEGVSPTPILLYEDDVLHFNTCSLWYKMNGSTMESRSGEETVRSLSEDYVLGEAFRGLQFIRRSSDGSVLQQILPNILSNLKTL